MGHVFTPDEFAEGKIPNLEDYLNAMRTLRQRLEELAEENKIHGAAIHGSTVHENVSIGSDIDILVVTKSPDADEHLAKLYREIKNDTNVPVEFVPLDIKIAQEGSHQIEYFYLL